LISQVGIGAEEVRSRSHASARLLLDLARAHETTEPERSRILVQQARAVARSENDQPCEAESLYRLASLAHYDGQPGDAFALAVEARDFAMTHDVPLVMAWALNLIGLVHTNSGNHSEALSCCLQALDCYRGTGHRIDEGNMLNTIATIYHELGDTNRAIVNYEAAINANAQLNRPDFDAITWSNVSALRAERGEYEIAIEIGEKALELCRVHAVAFLPEVLAALASAYRGLGDFDKARQLLHGALAILDSSSIAFDDAVRARVELACGQVEIEASCEEQALIHLHHALGLAQVVGAKPTILAAHSSLAEVYKRLRRFEEAVQHLDLKFETNQLIFNEGTDIRIKTLQVAHEAEESRQQAEILRLRTSELEGLVLGRTTELEQFQLEALERLAILGEFRDTDTGEHTTRVGDMCGEIAELLGQDHAWCERLRLAARLHDIGKVAIPDSILLKPGPLSPAEFEVMKTHTTVGARILSGSHSPLVQLAQEVALNHHERWDGTGYPRQIGATEVPLSGRICAVADVFDALTSERVYKKAWTVDDAVRYISRAAGTQFDPTVVEAFMRIVHT